MIAHSPICQRGSTCCVDHRMSCAMCSYAEEAASTEAAQIEGTAAASSAGELQPPPAPASVASDFSGKTHVRACLSLIFLQFLACVMPGFAAAARACLLLTRAAYTLDRKVEVLVAPNRLKTAQESVD